uniref:E3 ubiquitin-protein ligase n=1 Tax=Callorhinchus milii TaxID=7868 RepID=V9KD37_CALMI
MEKRIQTFCNKNKLGDVGRVRSGDPGSWVITFKNEKAAKEILSMKSIRLEDYGDVKISDPGLTHQATVRDTQQSLDDKMGKSQDNQLVSSMSLPNQVRSDTPNLNQGGGTALDKGMRIQQGRDQGATAAVDQDFSPSTPGRPAVMGATSPQRKIHDIKLDTISLPLHHYDYISKMYEREIQVICDTYKVDLCPEVKLSVRAQGHFSVKKAQDEYSKIFQEVIPNLEKRSIPFPPDVKDEMPKILAKYSKLMADKVKDGYSLTGPRQEIDCAEGEVWRAVHRSEQEKNSGSKFLDEGFDINPFHCHVLRLEFAAELIDIENKYKVLINFHDKDSDTKRLCIKSPLGSSSMVRQALEVLISFYQTVGTNTVMVHLERGADLEAVVKAWHTVRSKYRNMFVENSRMFFLAGMKETVVEAVNELHAMLGRKVFQEVPGLGKWSDVKISKQAGGNMDDQDNKCPICLDFMKNKKTLQCKHSFCTSCIEMALTNRNCCPICQTVFGSMQGNQPDGTMSHHILQSSLPGFNCPTIVIKYDIPDGIQQRCHPNPGQRFTGTSRTAYLPNNREGQHVMKLLKKAFHLKHIFTVGTSITSGQKDVVTWNDIHHKTSQYGGPQSFGYPDPGYLSRVCDELKAKGIV